MLESLSIFLMGILALVLALGAHINYIDEKNERNNNDKLS